MHGRVSEITASGNYNGTLVRDTPSYMDEPTSWYRVDINISSRTLACSYERVTKSLMERLLEKS